MAKKSIEDFKNLKSFKNESSKQASSEQKGIGKQGYSNGLCDSVLVKIREHERVAREYPKATRRLQVYLTPQEMVDLSWFLALNKMRGSEFARQMILAGMRNFKKKKPKKQTTEAFVQKQMFEGE